MNERIDKINLDLTLISLVGLSIGETMAILKLFFDDIAKQFFEYEISDKDIQGLLRKKFIKKIVKDNYPDRYILRTSGKSLVEKLTGVMITMEGDQVTDTVNLTSNEILVRDIRDKFRGKKTGSMGDEKALAKKLDRWKKEHPNVSDKEILKATDAYLDSLKGNYRFLQRADYFVYKQNAHKDESSRLSMFVEEIRTPEENSDWTTNII